VRGKRQPGERHGGGGEENDREDVDPGVRGAADAEGEVGEQDSGEAGQHGPRHERGEGDEERERDEEDRGLRVAIRANAVVEPDELSDRVVCCLRGEAAFPVERGWRDVRDGDEAGDPRRVRGEETVVSGAEDRDRVAAVVGLRAARGQPDDDRASRRWTLRDVGLEQRRAWRLAAEERVPDLAALERCEGALSARIGAGVRYQQSHGPTLRERA
jgi:hypothetical protein